jgi:hypothetical protein
LVNQISSDFPRSDLATEATWDIGLDSCFGKTLLVTLPILLSTKKWAGDIRGSLFFWGAVYLSLGDIAAVYADCGRLKIPILKRVVQALIDTALLPQQAVIKELALMPNTGAF